VQSYLHMSTFTQCVGESKEELVRTAVGRSITERSRASVVGGHQHMRKRLFLLGE